MNKKKKIIRKGYCLGKKYYKNLLVHSKENN